MTCSCFPRTASPSPACTRGSTRWPTGHRGRLDALHAHLAEPRRALDCFTILFGRKIDDSSLGLATGEAMAHLRRLEVDGKAAREERDGVYWFRAASA